MRAGKLRKRFEIQTSTESRDAHGGVTKTWTLAATRWGSIDREQADERTAGNQVGALARLKVVMRYYEGLTHDMRLRFGTRYLYIVEILNPGEIGRDHELLVKEEAA